MSTIPGKKLEDSTAFKMVQTDNLTFQYKKKERTFSFPNITLKGQENLLILGKSGIGKTTLLHLLAGLLKPVNGKVVIVLFAFTLGFLFVKTGLYFMFTFIKADYNQNILQELPFQEVLQIGALVFIMIILAVSLAIYPIIKMNISTILSNEK